MSQEKVYLATKGQVDAVQLTASETKTNVATVNTNVLATKTEATTAKTNAANAVTAANNAKTAADNAKTAADNAKTAADNAKASADAAKVAAEAVDGKVDGIVDATSEMSQKVTNLKARMDEIAQSTAAGSNYMATVCITFNTGIGHSAPTGQALVDAMKGAYVDVQTDGGRYSYATFDISEGAKQFCFIPCTGEKEFTAKLVLGHTSQYFVSLPVSSRIKPGELTNIVIDTQGAFVPPTGQEMLYRAIGRAQFTDDPTKNTSFLIVRDVDSEGHITQIFGHYEGTTWVSECPFKNKIPNLTEDGAIVNIAEVGDLSGTFEQDAWPWNAAEKRDVVVNEAMITTGSKATNVFKFTWIPVYAFKESDETLTFVTKNSSGEITQSVEHPCRIQWVAHREMIDVDNGFEIPSWEKVWKRVKDESTGVWSSVAIGEKEGNYYARYKTTANNTGVSRQGGATSAGTAYLQSYPTNLTTNAISRHTSTVNARRMDDLSVTIGNKVYPGLTNTDEMWNRRFACMTWQDYEAYRKLIYIQFGADAQNTTDGIKGVTTSTSTPQTTQDYLESRFEARPDFKTFTAGDRTSVSVPFAWLWILNPWGSEGDQMDDATTVQETVSDGTQYAFNVVQIDRAKMLGDTSGTASSYENLTNNGYQKLDYYWSQPGYTSAYYRGEDSRPELKGFVLPANIASRFNITLGSSPCDGLWLGSYPGKPDSDSAYAYRNAVLSSTRSCGSALGPWCVAGSRDPGDAYAGHWGSRLSINILRSEANGEAT